MNTKQIKRFKSGVIKEARTSMGMSREDLARKFWDYNIKKSHMTILNWESESTRPNADDLAVLSVVLGVKIQDFFI